MTQTPRRWRLAAPVAIGVLAAGLWISFHYSLGAWGPDADTVFPLDVWDGFRRHGLAFLPSWSGTPDNWLLSLVPLTSAVFEIAGPRPDLIAPMGWLIFVASVGMTAVLVGRACGWRPALVAAGALLLASFPALGAVGYLAHPVTHNISMAWALLALILAQWGVERADLACVAGAALCVFVDVASDPWAIAALAAPLVVVSGIVALAHRRTRPGFSAGLVCAATMLAVVAARLVAALAALPASPFALTNAAGLAANFRWLQQALAAMFNVIPFTSPGATPVQVFDLVALAAVVGSAMALTLAGLRAASPGRQLVGGVATLSILAVLALYLAQPWFPGAYIGRFFPNLYFFGGWLVATGPGQAPPRWRAWTTAAAAAYALCFALSGVASRPALWTGQEPLQNGAQARALAGALAAQGLTYGYGTYWGAEATAIQWVSQGRVIVRPVTFASGTVARRGVPTSSFWYAPADEPAHDPRRFLIVASDWEECPSVAGCVAMADKQFGPPAQSLVLAGQTILVWNRPISAQIGK